VLEALLARYPGTHGRHLERLIVKRDDGWIPVPLDRVRRLSAEGKHVRVHTGGGSHLIREASSSSSRGSTPRASSASTAARSSSSTPWSGSTRCLTATRSPSSTTAAP
jgi:hypothetical protein